MAKAKSLDYHRLTEARRAARRVLERFRVDRKAAVERYAGPRWTGRSGKDYINLLGQFISIMTRRLIPKEPRVMLSTFDVESKPAVSAMETWANLEIERQGLAETFQKIVIDAFFSIGIAKICLTTPEDSALSGWAAPAGSAGLYRVDLDDFAYDHHANDFREAAWICHRYRMPLDIARENPRFDKKLRAALTRSNHERHNESGDERIGELGRGDEGYLEQDFSEYVDLWEYYLPRYQTIATFADDGDEPLEEKQWLGPETGPYEFLAFHWVPGNAFPVSPVSWLHNLHILVNNLYAKLARQAERQKSITAAQGAADADGKRVIDANDGEMIRVDNPQHIQQLMMGGPDQRNLAFYMMAAQEFDKHGGNLSLLGGLGAQSPTAKQDAMLNENAGGNLFDKQETANKFLTGCLKKLAWFWWHDPFKVMQTTYALPGMPDKSITRRLTPEQRPWAKWHEIDLRLDVYALQHQTPQGRVAAISSIIKELYMPLAPLAQQQGILLDLRVLFEKIGRYLDQPDLWELLSLVQPPQAQPGVPGGTPGQQGMGGMPASTSREYVRESRPTRTQQGNEMNMMNALMGVNGGGSPNGQMAG